MRAYNGTYNSDESNKVTSRGDTISAKPDLTITGTFPYTEVVAGGTYTVNYNVKNQGGAGTGKGFQVTVYLSADQILDGNDPAIGSESVNAMPSNNDHSSKIDIVIPATLSGNVYILLKADSKNEIDESDENNNVFAIPVKTPLPITLRGFSIQPQVSPGEKLTLTYEVENKDSKNAQITLGATIKDSAGREIEDPQNDDRAEVPPGIRTYQRVFTIPVDVTPGPATVRLSIWVGDKPFTENRRVGDSGWIQGKLTILSKLTVKGRFLFSASWWGGNTFPLKEQDVELRVNGSTVETASTGRDGRFVFQNKVNPSDKTELRIRSENRFGKVVDRETNGKVYEAIFTIYKDSGGIRDFGEVTLKRRAEGGEDEKSIPWITLDVVRVGHEFVVDKGFATSAQIGQVEVSWGLVENISGAYYTSGKSRITLQRRRWDNSKGDRENGDSPGVILHEYGHLIDDKFSLTDGQGGKHAFVDTHKYGPSMDDENLQKLALSEGWANFFAVAIIKWWSSPSEGRSWVYFFTALWQILKRESDNLLFNMALLIYSSLKTSE